MHWWLPGAIPGLTMCPSSVRCSIKYSHRGRRAAVPSAGAACTIRGVAAAEGSAAAVGATRSPAPESHSGGGQGKSDLQLHVSSSDFSRPSSVTARTTGPRSGTGTLPVRDVSAQAAVLRQLGAAGLVSPAPGPGGAMGSSSPAAELFSRPPFGLLNNPVGLEGQTGAGRVRPWRGSDPSTGPWLVGRPRTWGSG